MTANPAAPVLDAFETWFATQTRAEQMERFSHSYYMRIAWNAALSTTQPVASSDAIFDAALSKLRLRQVETTDGIVFEIDENSVRAALQAAFATPADMVMVPREPTEAMLDAAEEGWLAEWGAGASVRAAVIKSVYKAMLAAASPAGKQGE